MNNIIVGGCIYNEEKKFLKKWLEAISKITNKILIIDDGSTDNSLSICSKYTSYILQTNRLYFMGENKLRELWWNEASKIANDGDFLFPIDADNIITENSILNLEKEIYNCNKLNGDAIAGHCYDMWNEKEYREEPEKGWFESTKPWINCVKLDKTKQYYWYNMYIHCGSIPINGYFSAYPCKLQMQHLGFSTPELRKEKINFYNQYDPHDIINEKNRKYKSFLDENPKLYPFIDLYEKNKNE